MRYREPFTVFPRKMSSGRKVWYYQTYDQKGLRTGALSTGQLTKSAARAYCRKLEKEGSLVPNKYGRILFSEYAKDWWDMDKCEYVRYRKQRTEITPTYLRRNIIYTNNHITPYFKEMRLEEITQYEVEKWMTFMVEKKSEKTGKKLANKSINGCLMLLHIMMAEAVRRNLITEDPTRNVGKLKSNSKVRGIFDQEIVEKLFDTKTKGDLWVHDLYYWGNLLAACTGMRMSEVLGVQLKDLKDGYVSVTKQYNHKFGFIPTKTKESREIPIPEDLENKLKELSNGDPEDMLFCLGEDKTEPVTMFKMGRSLNRALAKIGIDDKTRQEQGYSFHSWRHYFNTIMRSNNIADSKLQSLTGHKSDQMTDHYTHFKHKDFEDVARIQAKILPFKHAQ